MNVYELVEKVGGEICMGRARVRVGREIIELGNALDGDMKFSEAGQKMANELKPKAKPKAKAKAKATTKK